MYKTNKPVKNFQKKKYNNHSDKKKGVPKEEGIKNQQKKQEQLDNKNNSITGGFNEKKKITMKEGLNGTFTVDPTAGITIGNSKDGKKKLVLNQ